MSRNLREETKEKYIPVLEATVEESLKMFSKFFNPKEEGLNEWRNNFIKINQGKISSDREVDGIFRAVEKIKDLNPDSLGRLLEEVKKKHVKLLNPNSFKEEVFAVLPLFGVGNYLLSGSSIEGGFFKNFLREIKSLMQRDSGGPLKLSEEDVNNIVKTMSEFITRELTNEIIDPVITNLGFLQKYSQLNLRETVEEWHKHFGDRVYEVVEEIEYYRIERGIKWLRFFIYTIPLASGGIIYDLIKSKPPIGEIGLIEIGLSALVLVSTLSYHLKQSLRELNVLKHMRSSYLHRKIVAQTLKSLLASGAEFGDKNGNVVVQEAAMAMFGKESYGYLSKDQMESSNTPIQGVIGSFSRGG